MCTSSPSCDWYKWREQCCSQQRPADIHCVRKRTASVYLTSWGLGGLVDQERMNSVGDWYCWLGVRKGIQELSYRRQITHQQHAQMHDGWQLKSFQLHKNCTWEGLQKVSDLDRHSRSSNTVLFIGHISLPISALQQRHLYLAPS